MNKNQTQSNSNTSDTNTRFQFLVLINSIKRTEKGKDFKVVPSVCIVSKSRGLVSFSSLEKVKRIKKARRTAGLVN